MILFVGLAWFFGAMAAAEKSAKKLPKNVKEYIKGLDFFLFGGVDD